MGSAYRRDSNTIPKPLFADGPLSVQSAVGTGSTVANGVELLDSIVSRNTSLYNTALQQRGHNCLKSRNQLSLFSNDIEKLSLVSLSSFYFKL
jgi:hypothetical protein